MVDYIERPREAYFLSMIGGILIAAGGLLRIILVGLGRTPIRFEWLATVARHFGTRFYLLNIENLGLVIGLSGLVLGIGILLASSMLNRRSDEHGLWGVVIIILSAMSMMIGMGGMGIGFLLGIVGGAVAILWHPQNSIQSGSNNQGSNQ